MAPDGNVIHIAGDIIFVLRRRLPKCGMLASLDPLGQPPTPAAIPGVDIHKFAVQVNRRLSRYGADIPIKEADNRVPAPMIPGLHSKVGISHPPGRTLSPVS